jgi:hypothetical protein
VLELLGTELSRRGGLRRTDLRLRHGDAPGWLDAAMNLPACPLCGNTEYDREEERTDTKWGFSTHIKVLLICTQCRYVLTFYDKNSIFDFD